jgi:nucleotide-binding universal stress UspA family protein
MPTFKHILFPVDFSERCRAVRPFVQSMAVRYKAKLTLMHIVQLSTDAYGVSAIYPAVFDLSAMSDNAATELKNFLDPSAPEIPIQRIIEVGDPASYISAYSDANGVDLIMMPTHGYGKFRGLLLGSVTAKVLHDAKVTVWTSTHTEDPNLLAHLPCKSILCAVDLSAGSAAMIGYSAELAREYNAKLRLVHAVHEPASYPEVDFSNFLRQIARDEIAKLQRDAGTNFEVCLEGGSAAHVIRAAAFHHEADLVVIGRGSIHETFGRLRTNAYNIIRDSPCPVLSV